MDKIAKHKAKDYVFTDLFGNPKYLFELYKTLHPEDTAATVDSIEIITIENVLINGVYNDLGFIVGDKLVVLVECQSIWSLNILVRILLYYANSYHEYLLRTKQNFYGSAKVRLPKPEAYIIFTGERRNKPERISLSEEFFSGQDTDIEVKAKVIYKSDSRDIINQYILFCNILNDRIKIHGKTKKAVEQTISICQDKDILKEYLEARKKEVITMLDSLFNEEVIMEMHDNSIRREAEEKGRNEGRRAGAKIIAKKLLSMRSMPEEEIADVTGLTIIELEKLRTDIGS